MRVFRHAPTGLIIASGPRTLLQPPEAPAPTTTATTSTTSTTVTTIVATSTTAQTARPSTLSVLGAISRILTAPVEQREEPTARLKITRFPAADRAGDRSSRETASLVGSGVVDGEGGADSNDRGAAPVCNFSELRFHMLLVTATVAAEGAREVVAAGVALLCVGGDGGIVDEVGGSVGTRGFEGKARGCWRRDGGCDAGTVFAEATASVGVVSTPEPATTRLPQRLRARA